MRALLQTLLLYNIIFLFWNCTIATAASLQLPPVVPSLLQLAQFSPSSRWPGSETSGDRFGSPRRQGRAAPTQLKVPLPSRRPVIDAGTNDVPAPSPALPTEAPRVKAPDHGPSHTATVTGQGVEAVVVGDDPAWLHCSGDSGSTEGTGPVRIQSCTEILARSPAEPAERRKVALTRRAMAYDSLNSDRTLGDYSALLELNPDDMQILFLRSSYHARQQKYDLAVADLDRIVAAQPASARAYAERGRVYELKKDLNSAETDYRKAVDIDPNNSEYTSNLENIAKLRLAESEKNKLKKSVVFGPDDATYRSCANFSDSPDKRIEACSVVISRLPALEIESAFFSVEKTENLSKSIDRISTATGFDTTWMNISSAIGLRGLAYAEKRDLESALVDINNAIDKAGRIIYRDGTASTLDRMMLRRGDIFMELGEHQRAEDDYRMVTRINLVAEAHTRLASLHFALGRYDQAQEEIRIALHRDPKDGLAYSLRGRIGLAQGDYSRALEDCQRAVDIQPRNSPNARACIETARNALQGNVQPAAPGTNPAKAE